jgi:hypothetical protein
MICRRLTNRGVVVFYWSACVDKYRLKEVADFVGLDYSTITPNGTAEARKHQE